MRIDKYLKVSRIIKRRTLASEACTNGKVLINDKEAKPGANVKEGDIITLTFGEKVMKVKVTMVCEHMPKDGAKDMYEIL